LIYDNIEKNDLLILGNFKFIPVKKAFNQITKANNYRWEEIRKYKNKSSMFFSGEDLKTISISGEIYTRLSKELDPFKNLYESAENGENLTLISSSGEVLGEFIVLNINVSESSFSKFGVANKIGFTLNLKEYN